GRVTGGAGEPPHLGAPRVGLDSLRCERLEQQVAPARQEEGPVVELEGQQGARCRLFEAEKAVANLPGAGPQVETAVPQTRQDLAVADPVVGRPDAAG